MEIFTVPVILLLTAGGIVLALFATFVIVEWRRPKVSDEYVCETMRRLYGDTCFCGEHEGYVSLKERIRRNREERQREKDEKKRLKREEKERRKAAKAEEKRLKREEKERAKR